MQSAQLIYEKGDWQNNHQLDKVDLIISFMSPERSDKEEAFSRLQTIFSDAIVIGCTTGGEILQGDVSEDAIAAIALNFEKTRLKLASTLNDTHADSYSSGSKIAASLLDDDLAGIFILSEGLNVNGSYLVKGLRDVLPDNIPVSGGLAGDGDKFGETLVGVNGKLQSGMIAAIGFYGENISLQHGSAGGWDVFGPERTITRSKHNVLYELDNKPALELYKNYLGDNADALPGSALLYPLRIKSKVDEKEGSVVRTVLAVSEEDQSLTFAGNMPEDYSAQLMTGHFDNLITGAHQAAKKITPNSDDGVAILISCIGRKLTLNQRTYEEVEEVEAALGPQTNIIGFYSYGELCRTDSTNCQLHNQTMTITYISEK